MTCRPGGGSVSTGRSPGARALPARASARAAYLEELEAEAEEADVFRRRRARLGETDMPSFFLGDLDRRHGSFHSSARFTWGPAAASFLGGSACRLQSQGPCGSASPPGRPAAPPRQRGVRAGLCPPPHAPVLQFEQKELCSDATESL